MLTHNFPQEPRDNPICVLFVLVCLQSSVESTPPSLLKALHHSPRMCSKEAKPKLKTLFSGVLGEYFYEKWNKKNRTEHEEKLSKEVSQLETSFLR